MTESAREKGSPVHGLIKTVALLVGLPLCLLALMALAGGVVSNIWAQLGIALAVMLGPPLFVADKLIPDDDVRKGRGVPTDVLAITWMLIAAAVLGFGARWTGPLLRGEADHLRGTPFAFASAPLRWLAGPEDEAVAVVDEPEVEEEVTVVDASTPDAHVDAGAPEPADSPEIADEPLEPSAIFERWADSVVAVQVNGELGQGGGTGFFVTRDHIVTNSHVVHDMENVFVKLKDGVWATDVELLDEDETRDLALLRVAMPEVGASVVLGDAEAVRVGARAISIGNPLGLEHTLTDGLISSRRLYAGRRYFQTSAPISPGNSGGPLFDDHGRVIGVSVAQVGAGFSRAQNLNLAIPVDDLQTFLARTPEQPPKRIGGGEPEQRPGSW